MTLIKRLGLSPFDRRTLPVAAVLAMSLYTAVTGQITLVTIGSYNFQTTEFVLLVTLPFLLASLRPRKILLSITGLFLVLYVAIFAFALVRGLPGGMSAVLSLRSTAIMPVFLLYALLNVGRQDFFQQSQKLISLAALLVALLLWARTALGPQLFYQTGISADQINDGGRSISADSALLLAMGAMIALAEAFRLARMNKPAQRQFASFAFLALSLAVSLQGSATLAGIAGLAVIIALIPGPLANIRFVTASTIALISVLAIILVPEIFDLNYWFSLLPADLAFHLGRRVSNVDTRTEVWSSFMAAFAQTAPIEQLFGPPAGQRVTVIVRLWGGRAWEHGLHSAYFGLLASLGFFGLTAFGAIMLALALRCFKRANRRETPSPVLGLAIIIALAVFGYAYDIRNEHAVYLLIAIGAAFGTIAVQERTNMPERL